MTQLTTPETVIFTDLDDSLFQTRRKCSGDEISPAAYNRQGEAISFHTPQQRAFIQLLGRGQVIPVTGRSSDALARVRSLKWSSYRVVSHGALILDLDHQPLASWYAHIDREVTQWAPRFTHAHEHITRWVTTWSTNQSQPVSDPIRVSVVSEDHLKVYVSIKGPRRALIDLKSELKHLWSDGIIHHNDRNMALLPSYASKSRAVAHLQELITQTQTIEPLFVGVGDSVSDLAFLKLCHFAITPQQSQIHQELW
jgi:hypothetical protein